MSQVVIQVYSTRSQVQVTPTLPLALSCTEYIWMRSNCMTLSTPLESSPGTLSALTCHGSVSLAVLQASSILVFLHCL